MKIIYYSRGSLVLALLCAEKQLHPDSTLEYALQRVQDRYSSQIDQKSKVLLLPYKEDAAEIKLYVLTASAPPWLVERTLTSVHSLLAAENKPDPFVMVSSLPFFCYKSRSDQADLRRFRTKLKHLWPEIRAAVEQARLQIEWRNILK